MRIGKIVLSLLMWSLLAGMVSHELAKCGVPEPVSIVLCLAGTFLMSYMGLLGRLPKITGVTKSDLSTGIDVNIWAKEIIKRLFKDNMFLKYAKNENQYVQGGMAVLIPQPGARPNVVKNRNSFPATAIRRTDTTISYLLDEYSTDPTHITLNELATISYDKINSIIDDHFGYLLQDCADDMLVKWASGLPAAAIISTSGGATAALESGQTGNRNSFTWQDLAEAQRIMNKGNVSKKGRIALFEENVFQQLLYSLSNTPYKDFSKEMDAKEGTMGRLFGFDIMTRSTTFTAANALSAGTLSVNDIDASIGATDNVGVLCWQTDIVACAQGTVNLFNQAKSPFYYGDVNSVSMRAGGRVRRADNQGIVAIMQGQNFGN